MSIRHSAVQLADDCEAVTRSIQEIATLWPDFSFDTPDARTFNFIEDSVSSISGRVKGRGLLLTEREQAELERIRGAIVEVESADPPMLFDSSKSLIQAWCELHDSFYVPLTDCERELPELPADNVQGDLSRHKALSSNC